MNPISLIKAAFPHEFRQRWKRRLFAVRDLPDRLGNLKRSGFEPRGAVDGGACYGDWTREFWNVWPRVPVLMIEPQPECALRLSELSQSVRSSEHLACALGPVPGTARFTLGATNSHIATEDEPSGDSTIEVPVETIDQILETRPDFDPGFLKLDLQGFELEALRGASRSLRRFEVILLEVSVIQIGPVPSFREVDRFMEAAGFRIYDLIPQYYRPLDGALWQADVFYVRDDSKLVASREWI